MTTLYHYDDYRDLLRDCADAKKAQDPAYKYADLAAAMGVQPPYLSRVFRKEAHLSSDQLDLASSEFQFSDREADFALLLLELQKSGLAKRRKKLQQKVDSIRKEQSDTKHHLAAETIRPEDAGSLQEYFLEPLAPLVHAFLTVPQYQANPGLISRQLSLSPRKLEEILSRLEKLGMIAFAPELGRFRVLKDHLHLDKSSILNQAYQLLFRAMGSEHVKRIPDDEKHQFAVTITADEETKRRIYDEFNEFLKRIEPLVRQAPAQGVFQLNFDLFRWDSSEGAATRPRPAPHADRRPS